MVGIYTEDGNEMGNAFVRNVVVCTTWDVCHVDTAITDAVFASGDPLPRARCSPSTREGCRVVSVAPSL